MNQVQQLTRTLVCTDYLPRPSQLLKNSPLSPASHSQDTDLGNVIHILEYLPTTYKGSDAFYFILRSEMGSVPYARTFRRGCVKMKETNVKSECLCFKMAIAILR